jgi:hypothetical protein
VPAGTRINRALWTFRAIIALVALFLLAMILRPEAFQAQEPSAPQLTTARGPTAQGVALTMRFDRPGHPIAFSTRLRARCTNPSRTGSWDWSWGWWPADGTPAPFHRDGRALRVTQVADRWFDDGVFGQIVFTMNARAAPGVSAAGGWLRMSATFFYPVGTTTCDSGRVPFAVGATSARPS